MISNFIFNCTTWLLFVFFSCFLCSWSDFIMSWRWRRVWATWRMWSCTVILDQLLVLAFCWKPQRSFWRLFPVGPFPCSHPGSPRLQTATSPSDRPKQLLSSPSLRAGLLGTEAKDPEQTVLLLKDLRNLFMLRDHHMNPKLASQKPWTASSQPSLRSPDCLLTNTNMSQPHYPGGPGASLCRVELWCRDHSHCPNNSVTWCLSTDSTSARGSNGWSVSKTVGQPETSNRSVLVWFSSL